MKVSAFGTRQIFAINLSVGFQLELLLRMERRRDKRPKRMYRSDPGPTRIPPTADPAEAIQRLVPRTQLRLEAGDILVVREPMPRLQLSAAGTLWWFRVSTYLTPEANSRVFTSFHHAASHGEQLAAQCHARLLLVEDGVPTLLNDYRA